MTRSTMHLPETRWTAFAIHLALSAAIFAALLAVIVLLLFPGGLFTVAGGWQGIRLIAGVDLVLGPLLTLIVYNVAKPRRELIRDLSIIASVQVAALAAGMWIVYLQRPVAVTWVHDRFVLSRHADYVAADERASALPGYRVWSPTINYVALPEAVAQAQQIIANYALSGEKIQVRVDLVQPLPSDPGKAAQVMRHNPLGGQAAPAGCVPVEVASRFGDARLCYRPERQVFDAL